jgi:large subunit ribosomal protein L19
MSTRLDHIEAAHAKTNIPQFKVGDHVSVGVLIREPPPPGAKKQEMRSRVQHFIGDVIAIGGQGLGRSFTVRRVSQGEGVERVFPFHSPLVKDIEILRRGDVRRAKLYDLRQKSGKAARIKERTMRKGEAAALREQSNPDPAKKPDSASEES